MSHGEYFIQYYFLWIDTSQFFLVLKEEVISTPVVVVVVVVAEIISTRVAVVVGGGGDYRDTYGGGRGRRRLSRELSCSETVLWTTNCPLVLAYCGLGTAVTFSGHFQWSLYTLGFKVYFCYP